MIGQRFDPLLVMVIVLAVVLGAAPRAAILATLAALLMAGAALGLLYLGARIVLPPAPRPPKDRR